MQGRCERGDGRVAERPGRRVRPCTPHPVVRQLSSHVTRPALTLASSPPARTTTERRERLLLQGAAVRAAVDRVCICTQNTQAVVIGLAQQAAATPGRSPVPPGHPPPQIEPQPSPGRPS